MSLVETIADIVKNIETLDAYTRGSAVEQKFSRARIKNGKLFVACLTADGYIFAPSKFAGYKNNDLKHAELLFDRDGRETNVEITRLLKGYIGSDNPRYSEIDEAYLDYCGQLGITASNHHLKRRYWFADGPMNAGVIRYPDELEDETHFEGARQQAWVNKFERNEKARAACIAHFGAKCSVCDFDFKDVYGEIGSGYIHVHHIVPISSVGKQYAVDPLKDLRPVCPNCHAMLHRGPDVLSIEALGRLIRNERSS